MKYENRVALFDSLIKKYLSLPTLSPPSKKKSWQSESNLSNLQDPKITRWENLTEFKLRSRLQFDHRRKSWRKCLKQVRAKTALQVLNFDSARVTRTNLHFPSWRPATLRISDWKGFQERVRCVLRATRLGNKAALMEVSC